MSEKSMFANVFVCNHEIPNYCYRHITYYTHFVTIIIAILILIDLPLIEKGTTDDPTGFSTLIHIYVYLYYWYCCAELNRWR